MRIMHNHICTLTSRPSTCYVFDEFPLLFSMSTEAYDQLKHSLPFQRPEEGLCSFCEEHADVKTISGFSNPMLFSDLHICSKCSHKMEDLVDFYPENA